MKQSPLEFYLAEKARFEQKSTKLKKQLTLSSTIRLVAFLIICFGLYLTFGNIKAMIGIAVIGFLGFLYLVYRHSDLQYEKDVNNKLVDINTTEINVLNGDYLSLDIGSEFINSAHFYSYDIDLFGKGSFFQYINRTATNEGKKQLADILTENQISEIESKQEAINELANKRVWRQHFTAIASLVNVQHPAKDIINWIHNYTQRDLNGFYYHS